MDRKLVVLLLLAAAFIAPVPSKFKCYKSKLKDEGFVVKKDKECDSKMCVISHCGGAKKKFKEDGNEALYPKLKYGCGKDEKKPCKKFGEDCEKHGGTVGKCDVCKKKNCNKPKKQEKEPEEKKKPEEKASMATSIQLGVMVIFGSLLLVVFNQL